MSPFPEHRTIHHAAPAPQSVGESPRLWGFLDELASTEAEEKGWDEAAVKELLSYDTCCDVAPIEDEEGELIGCGFMFGPYELEINYIYKAGTPPRGRYRIDGAELDQAVTTAEVAEDPGVEEHPDERFFGRKLPTSLIRSINQQQSFQVIAITGECVYSLGHFFKPALGKSLLEVAQCAIAPIPDSILGEQACCYVVMKPGAQLTFDELSTFLLRFGIAKYKLRSNFSTNDYSEGH